MKLSLQRFALKGKTSLGILTPLMLAFLTPAMSWAANSELRVLKETNEIKNSRWVNVTGTVKDSKGEPLAGVTVKIKGTTTATATDADGVFRLNLPTGLETLEVSFIGFQSREIAAAGKSILNIVLQESTAALDEVVVVGYGTQKKIHLTGAVATVNIKEIEDLPVTNLSAAIKGQLPGVGVNGGTVRPGEAGAIQIRNPVFFAKDGQTEPLYVVDDIIRTSTDFNQIDASQVESISILKDAAAAIYGIQGANGVVIVKTKRGKEGAAKISYSGSVGSTDATMLPKMMTGFEHATYLNDLLQAKNGYNLAPDGTVIGTTSKIAEYYSPDELDYFKENSTDWLRKAWQTSYVQRHALNLTGGTDKVTYFAGTAYTQQNSNFKGVDVSNWSYRASVDAKVANGLKVALSVSGSMFDNERYYFKQGSESLDNDFKSLLGAPEFIPFYYNGLPVQHASNYNSVDAANFFEVQRLNNYTRQRTASINVNPTINWDVPFVKGLRATINYNRNINNDFSKQYGTRYTTYKFTNLGENKHIIGGDILSTSPDGIVALNGDIVRLTPGLTDNYQLNGILNYSRTIGKHDFSALALFEQYESEGESVQAYRRSVLPGGLDNLNFAVSDQVADQSGRVNEFGRLAYAARINYSYANKYLVELAFRADANTKFAPGKEWGYFPSASLGWVLSEEGFFHKNKFVNFLKVRGSVGLLGNDSTKPFQYSSNYKLEASKGAVFGGNNGRGLTYAPNLSIPNPDLTWDSNLKTNFGVDAQFLDSRLSLTADGFFEHRYNLLAALTSSTSFLVGASGSAIATQNYAEANTFGYEISLSWKDKIGEIGYRFSPFLSWNDNKYIISDQSLGDANTYLAQNGFSSDKGVLGYKYIGMFRSQEEADAYLVAHPGYTVKGLKPMAGMLYYEDVRGPKDASGNYTAPDGKINDEDQVYLTNKASNHYNLGLNFGGDYKGLTLGVTMGMSFGGQDIIESEARNQATATSSKPEFWKDHWTPENPNAKYPNPYYKDANTLTSDFWFVNSFTFRITNLNLSYNVPTKFVDKLNISSARIYLVSTNPINFYNPFSYRDNATSLTTYPNLRTISLGLNVGF